MNLRIFLVITVLLAGFVFATIDSSPTPGITAEPTATPTPEPSSSTTPTPTPETTTSVTAVPATSSGGSVGGGEVPPAPGRVSFTANFAIDGEFMIFSITNTGDATIEKNSLDVYINGKKSESSNLPPEEISPGNSWKSTSRMSSAADSCKDGKITFIHRASGATASATIPCPSSQPKPKHTLTFHPGWNQWSSPVFDSQVGIDAVAYKCSSQKKIWQYSPESNSYYAANGGLGPVGYWLKADHECTIEVSGEESTLERIGLLSVGWNLIGSPEGQTNFEDILGDCKGKVLNGPWHYDPINKKYDQAAALTEGNGYWLKVSERCTLGSVNNGPPLPPS